MFQKPFVIATTLLSSLTATFSSANAQEAPKVYGPEPEPKVESQTPQISEKVRELLKALVGGVYNNYYFEANYLRQPDGTIGKKEGLQANRRETGFFIKEIALQLDKAGAFPKDGLSFNPETSSFGVPLLDNLLDEYLQERAAKNPVTKEERASIKQSLITIQALQISIASHADIAKSIGRNQFAQIDELDKMSQDIEISRLGDFAFNRSLMKGHKFNVSCNNLTGELTTNVNLYNVLWQEIKEERAKAAGQSQPQQPGR